jgi:hypothetical protein
MPLPELFWSVAFQESQPISPPEAIEIVGAVLSQPRGRHGVPPTNLLLISSLDDVLDEKLRSLVFTTEEEQRTFSYLHIARHGSGQRPAYAWQSKVL